MAISIYSCFFYFAGSIRFNFKFSYDFGGLSLCRDESLASLEAQRAKSDFFFDKFSPFLFDLLVLGCNEFFDELLSINLHKFFIIDYSSYSFLTRGVDAFFDRVCWNRLSVEKKFYYSCCEMRRVVSSVVFIVAADCWKRSFLSRITVLAEGRTIARDFFYASFGGF